MNYTVKLTGGAHGGAEIVGLPDVYLHFASLDFDIVWNLTTRTQDVVRGVNVFFGGMGEGSKFDTWQAALLSSLYDAYQVRDELKNGDTFTAEFNGETAHFACEGIHVVEVRS